MPKVIVHPYYHADSGTWSYVVADAQSRIAAIIDPVLDFDGKAARTGTTSAHKLIECINTHGYHVQWILETHAHADHLTAAPYLKHALRKLDAASPAPKIAIGQGIRDVQATFKALLNLEADFTADGSQFDHLFVDGERFAIGAIMCEVIATPGHTSDSVSYLIGDCVFVGDSLLMPDSGTARCDFPGGDAKRLFASIQRLYQLPEQTRVFVCHDYGPNGREPRCETTIGDQEDGNIHVRDGVSEHDYVAIRKGRDATLAVPTLLFPAVQVNIRAGLLPPAERNGTHFLKIPVDRF
jgi:glyoxylase-like metal-dependent hydrolase (beta-lactamase superfamily II)